MLSSDEESAAGQSHPDCLAVHIASPGIRKAILKACWNKERINQGLVSAKTS